MGWQDRAAELCQRFDGGARLALPGVFKVLLPGRPDVPRLVAGALDGAATSRGTSGRISFPVADAARFDEVLALLEGPVGELCGRAGRMKHPGSGPRAVRQALARRPDVRAAQGRLHKLAAEGLRPFPARGRTARLHALPLAEGLQLGCWHVWERSAGIGVLLWNQASGRLVRVWTGSNGWWEYRTGSMRLGQIHIVWSSGNSSSNNNETYARAVQPPGPWWTFPPGAFSAEDWRFTAGKCELRIAHVPTRRVVTLGLASPLICCNDAALPDV